MDIVANKEFNEITGKSCSNNDVRMLRMRVEDEIFIWSPGVHASFNKAWSRLQAGHVLADEFRGAFHQLMFAFDLVPIVWIGFYSVVTAKLKCHLDSQYEKRDEENDTFFKSYSTMIL